MSEIVAAVVNEQLKGYPAYLASLRGSVMDFEEYLRNIEGVDLVTGNAMHETECSYTQVVTKLDSNSNISKSKLFSELKERGVPVWHGNFELITSLSFFKNDTWKEWLIKGDVERVQSNYRMKFQNAEAVYQNLGLGLGRMSFLSKGNRGYLKTELVKSIDASRI